MEPQSISSDLIRGHIDTIILYSLTDSDKFAQQISDAIEEKSDKEYKINQATLYSSLKRLETLKHVNSYWNDSPGGRRKYFRLTDLGKEAVESNLSNWSYSRAIIDKLMDCAPQPIYQTKVVEVEKIVEKVVEVEVPVVREIQQTVPQVNEVIPNLESQQVQTVPINEVPSATSSYVVTQPNVKPISQVDGASNVERQESEKEVNFRNILSGLIKSTIVNSVIIEPKVEPETKDELENSAIVNKEKLQPITIEKPKFNETLTAINYNPNKSIHTGKIDFGDLSIKAAKEGYKLRVSSKESYYQVGNLLIRKLKFLSALFIYLIVMLEFLLISSKYITIFNLSITQKCITSGALALFPIVMFIIFLKEPSKVTTKKVSVDSILTTAIIVFNLLLITLASNLLANVDFSNVSVILYSAVIPCVLYVDALIYFVIRFLFSKLPIFITKRKKTA